MKVNYAYSADEPQSHERGTMSSSSTKELGSFRESQT